MTTFNKQQSAFKFGMKPNQGQPKQQSASVIPSDSNIRKLVGASNRFGNRGIKNQQISTFEIYDYLPWTGNAKATLNFFENVNTRQFPLTNINSNQLQVGESMIIDRLHFTVMTYNATTGIVSALTDFQTAGIEGAYSGQLNWFNDNNRVLKNLSLTNMEPQFNKAGWSNINNSWHLDTKISMQPLVSFVCQLKLPAVTAEALSLYIGCHAIGVGTLLAPKTTY